MLLNNPCGALKLISCLCLIYIHYIFYHECDSSCKILLLFCMPLFIRNIIWVNEVVLIYSC